MCLGTVVNVAPVLVTGDSDDWLSVSTAEVFTFPCLGTSVYFPWYKHKVEGAFLVFSSKRQINEIAQLSKQPMLVLNPNTGWQ